MPSSRKEVGSKKSCRTSHPERFPFVPRAAPHPASRRPAPAAGKFRPRSGSQAPQALEQPAPAGGGGGGHGRHLHASATPFTVFFPPPAKLTFRFTHLNDASDKMRETSEDELASGYVRGPAGRSVPRDRVFNFAGGRVFSSCPSGPSSSCWTLRPAQGSARPGSTLGEAACPRARAGSPHCAPAESQRAGRGRRTP